jgi:DNA-directed RNA polymerase specialized sigma24 family protein
VRYRPAVVRLARTIVGADHAEDVAQDSLLLAFKALPRSTSRASLPHGYRPSHAIERCDLARAKRRRAANACRWMRRCLKTSKHWRRPLIDKHEDESMIKALDSLPADYAMPLRLAFSRTTCRSSASPRLWECRCRR